MNRPEVIIFSLLLLSWLIGMGWCHNATCPECQTVAAAVPPVTDNSALAIAIEDDDVDFETGTNDNLLFAANSCDYQTPLSSELEGVFQKTAEHLQNNSRRILVLTGLYEGNEQNECEDAADLGIARAEQVRQLLIGYGAPEGQIEMEASNIQDLDEYDSKLVGGVDYYFKEAYSPEVESAALRAENITLYFDTNKREINLTSEQRAYLDRLKAYLAANPDSKAKVTGYTDDRGEDKWNMRLSRKRSEFVRDFMIDQGISKRQITNKGMGPDDPIASNATEEGRAKNRRVEITLQ